MEIRRTGDGGLPPDPLRAGDDGTKPATDTTHDTARAASSETVAEFNRADLDDPVKLEGILSRYLGEFVDSASRRMDVPLSDAGKAAVVQCLASDPHVRERLVGFLRK